MDTFLICLVLVLAGLAQLFFCGSDALLRELTGLPAVEEVAAPVCMGKAADAAMAHEELLPEISCEGMPETGEPLRFLMQNVQNYFVPGEQRSRYVSSPKPEAAKTAVVRAIEKMQPDVVGLVEIGGPLALQDLRLRLEGVGLSYPYFRVLVRQGEDRALGVLSRYPIVADHSQAQVHLLGNNRRTMLRGILDVTVRADDGRLFRVVGVHLKSRVADDPAAAAALRMKEAYTLYLYLQREMQRQPAMPLLVYGDWNDTPDDPSVRQMLQGQSKACSLTRLEPCDTRGEEWTHFYARTKSYYVFDQLFINGVLKKRLKSRPVCGIVDVAADERGSDHRALWVELR